MENTYSFDKSLLQPPTRYKISFNIGEPELFLRLERNGKGGGHHARFHKILDVHIDSEYRILAGFKPTKEAAGYQYIAIGKLQLEEEVGF